MSYETTTAKKILNNIVDRRFGDTNAANELLNYREHPLTDMRNSGGDNFAGWTSFDLKYDPRNPNDHGIMRLLYREIN